MAEKHNNMAPSPGQAFNGQGVRRISRSALRIATWNVRSLYAPGKHENVDAEMQRLKIDILGISDVQWPGSGKISSRHGVMYYSGNSEPAHRYGVAIIVKEKICNSVVNFVPFSDRIIMLQFQTNEGKINVIQVYAPTADREENEIEEFYANLEEVLKSTKSNHSTIVMGDFNAKIGQGSVDKCVGEYGLGERNQRGDRMVEFCQTEDMVVVNTLFQLPERRRYTWKSPQDRPDKIVRNQIDFILIKQRFRNSILSAKTYPGADIGSDHNPVVACFRMKLKVIKKTEQRYADMRNLKINHIKQQISDSINENINNIKSDNANTGDINEKWENIKQAITSASERRLTPPKRKHKVWMTEEILELMNERRLSKTKDVNKYEILDKEIQRKIKEAKEQWLSDQCEEVEELERKYDFFNMHKKVKEISGTHRIKSTSLLKNTDGTPILDMQQKLKRWTEYIKELFNDEDRGITTEAYTEEGPVILREEIEYALKNVKSGKASGPDGIPVELLKLLNDDAISVLLDLFNTIYTTGIIPKEWLRSTFIPIPKKANAKDCNEHRTIALMCHTLKLFLRIIHNRIYKKLERELSDTQMGFRQGFGTREALFGLNILAQRCLDMNQKVYACFIDLEKAFDKVQHHRMINILKTKDVDSRDIRIIHNLYWNQTAKIKVENELTEEMEIRRGVRQGCVLSPLLFNLYSEAVFQEALEDMTEGLIINGEVLNNIRYADDTVILAQSMEDLQHLIERMNHQCNNYGLKINLKKTKALIVNKTTNNEADLIINNTVIEQVPYYKYLGTWITNTGDQSKEIRSRIETARSTFNKMRKFLCNRDVHLNLRIRMLRCYVFSTLLYGVEAWTLKQNNIRNIEAFEMWCYRRILKISWTEKISNVEVLQRVNKDCEVIKTIKTRKLQYLGHLMRGEKYSLLRNIMQGKIRGKRSVGRRKISWLRNLREWCGCSSNELFRKVANRVILAMMISNLR